MLRHKGNDMPAKKKGNTRERRSRPIGFVSQVNTPLDVRSRPQQESAGVEQKAQPVELRRQPPSGTEAQGNAKSANSDRPIPPSRKTASSDDSAESLGSEQLTSAGEAAAPVVAEGGADDGFTPGPAGQLGARRVRMGEALRIKGIDEHSVAEAYAGVVGMLKDRAAANDSVDKLLVDILKECSKHLEEDSKATGGAPVQVRLIHNVARPQRNVVAAAPSAASDSAANATEGDHPPTDESQV